MNTVYARAGARILWLFCWVSIALVLGLALWLGAATTPRARAAGPARPQAAVLIVNSVADSGPGSLRDALAAANAGDTIQFSLPDDSIIVLTGGELSAPVPLTIDGSTATNLALSGNNTSRVFNVSAPLTVISLTIEYGSADNGAGLYATGDVTLTSVAFLSNTATSSGGGAYVAGAATLNGGLFQNNNSTSGGGGLYAGARLALTGTNFLDNSSYGNGGGAYANSQAALNGGLFQSNSSANNGGGGLFANSFLLLTGTTFLSNTAYADGGGLNANSALASLVLTATNFVSNTSNGSGGGAYSVGATTLSGGQYQNNSSSGPGGGLYIGNALMLAGTQFLSNTANSGGGAYAGSTATLNDALFQSNTASLASGGGLAAGNSLALSGTNFLNNSASNAGGGVYAQGAVTLNGGLFQSNQCTGGACKGGGLFAFNSLALTGTQFLGNTSLGAGGGAVYLAGGAGRLVNGLFGRNDATSTTLGSALYLASSATVQILHTTIANPALGGGSAIYLTAGSLGITDTIIANSSTGINNAGGNVYQDYNLFFGNTSNVSGSSSSGGTHDVSGNPAFSNPAADNYHLTMGSAAIDKGVNAGVLRDLDGVVRPQFNGFDIGAYELPPPPPCAPVSNTNDSGAGSLRDTLICARPGDTVTFTLPANSVIVLTSSELTVTKALTIDASTATNLALSANHASRVFNVSAPLTVISLTIANGSAANGAGLYATGDVTLTSVAFLSNTATSSGGAAYVGGAVILNGGLFQSNNSASSGGGLRAVTTLALTGTQFLSNTAGGNGGGADVSGAVTLTGGLFQNNTSTGGYGGALRAGTLVLSGTTFLANAAGSGGGALYAGGAATLSSGLLQNNQCTGGGCTGGGLHAESTLALMDTSFLSNTATGNGGGLWANNTLVLTDTNFLSNTADGGGGAYAAGAITVNGGQFQYNTSTSGGGLYAQSTLALKDTNFLSNATSGPGGGAYASSAVTLDGGLFQANHSASSSGGALRALTTLALTDTQFLSNTASGNGGGADASGAVTLNGGLFQNNAGDNGGGLRAGMLMLSGTNFVGNSSLRLGGALYAGDVATLAGGLFQSNNSSTSGGGLYAVTSLVLTATQFLSNTAASGGGAYANDVATLNGGLFQNNTCTALGCLNGGWLVSGALNLTQFITTADSIENDGLSSQAAGAVILFNGSSRQTIAGAGSTTFNALWLANTGAGVWLEQNITVTDLLTLTSDLTTTDGYTLSLGANAASAGSGDVWGTTWRRHAFNTDTTYAFGNPNVSLNFTSGTPPTEMSVQLTHTIPISSGFGNAVSRFYEISQAGAGAFTATLRLHYQSGELNGNAAGSLKLWRYQPHGWMPVPVSAMDTVNNWVESNAVTAFSPWVISQNGPVPTAVTISSFGAVGGLGRITLTWTTESDVRVFGFQLERSTDGQSWTPLAFVPSQSPCNATTARDTYSYVDNALPAHAHYRYRLQLVAQQCGGRNTYFERAVDTTTLDASLQRRLYLPLIVR